MRFVFNHFIHLFKSKGRNDTQFYSEVYDQVEVMFEDLQKNFIEYLDKHYSTYYYQASREKPTWVANLFICSFAKYCPEKYVFETEKYFVNANFLFFFIDSYFLSKSSENQYGILRWDLKDILLPGMLFDKFINSLNGIKKGELSNSDQEHVNFFLKKLDCK